MEIIFKGATDTSDEQVIFPVILSDAWWVREKKHFFSDIIIFFINMVNYYYRTSNIQTQDMDEQLLTF